MKVHNGTYYSTEDLQRLMELLDTTLTQLSVRVAGANLLVEQRDVLVSYSKPGKGTDINSPYVTCDDARNIKLHLPTREDIFTDNDLERIGTGGNLMPVSAVRSIVTEAVKCYVLLLRYQGRHQLKNSALASGFITEQDSQDYTLPQFANAVANLVMAWNPEVNIASKSSAVDRLAAQVHRARMKLQLEKGKLDHHTQKSKDYKKLHEYHESKLSFHTQKLTTMQRSLADLMDRYTKAGGKVDTEGGQ